MITITKGLQAAIITELEKVTELNGNVYDADTDTGDIPYPFLVIDSWAKRNAGDKSGGGVAFDLTITAAAGKPEAGHRYALELTEIASGIIQQMENKEFSFQRYQDDNAGDYVAQTQTGAIHQVEMTGGQSTRQTSDTLTLWIASEQLTINVSIL